jgi:hypothetical protein
MTWVRYDDHAALHPKVAPLDDTTYRVWREAIEWCSRNLTDGRIAAEQLDLVSPRRATRARAGKLVARKLWHPAGEQCDSPKCPPSGKDGWVIHDYWHHQPTAEAVLADRAAKAKRQREYQERRRAELTAKKAAEAEATRQAANAVADASADAPNDASHAPSLNGRVDPPMTPPPSPVPVPVPEGRLGTGDWGSAAARLAEDGLGDGRDDQRPPPHPPSDPDPAEVEAERLAAAERVEAAHRGAALARQAIPLGVRMRQPARRPPTGGDPT